MDGIVKAGFSEETLTDALPERRETEIPLSVRGIYLSQGEKRTFLLISDLMDFDLQAVSLLEKAAASVLPHHTKIHILTTHNHGGAEWFRLDRNAFSAHAAACAERALRVRQAAKIRAACGPAGGNLTMTRRIFVPEAGGSFSCFHGIGSTAHGNASHFVKTALENLENGLLTFSGKILPGEEPERTFPEADPEGAILEFAAAGDGRPLGHIVRFAAHAVCCNRPDTYSPDYPGYLRRLLERELGGISVFLNGPCAEIAPAVPEKSAAEGRKTAEALGAELVPLLRKSSFQELRRFRDTVWRIPLPVRKEILNQHVSPAEIRSGKDLRSRKKALERKLLADNLPFLTRIYRNGESAPSGEITVSGALLELNDWNLLCFPGETFSETARNIICEFPDRNWITVTEHGRSAMYLPPRREYLRGGYEPSCAVVAEQGEKQLREKTAALLRKHFSRETPPREKSMNHKPCIQGKRRQEVL